MTQRFPARAFLVALALCFLLTGTVASQEKGDVEGPQPKPMNEGTTTRAKATAMPASGARIDAQPPKQHHAPQLLLDFADDQKALWSSPSRLNFQDASWLVPVTGITAGLFVTDADYNRHMSHDPHTLSRYDNISTAGAAGLAGSAGAMWLFSHFNHNAHWQETGFLAGEAALHSLVMTETMKYSFRRERPYQSDGSGQFFQPGGTSFPSEHSAAAWSIASVIAHEYPGPLTKILAYGAASLVTYSRVRADKHFNSDVVVGALIGQLVAHEIYKRHHDPELGGDVWNSPSEAFYDDGRPRTGFIGSPYVPLDSWIYPAIERLSAMGLVSSAYAGMKPWTRLVCAQMITEAHDRADGSGSVARDLVDELEREFGPELGGGADLGLTTARLESVYFRGEHISGLPLTDGYNFGSTQINDFGRPYGEGWSTVTGFSSYASSGPWVAYVRGEFQTSPSIPALPLAAREFVARADSLPTVAPATPTPSVQRFQLLDAYAGVTVANWELTFGRQSISWGPGDGGSLMLSDNAAPIDMFRINRVAPLGIPLVSRFLGPVRTEFFFGQLTGQQFVFGAVNGNGVVGSYSETLHPQPYIHGERFSFKPTRNFEFGFSRTAIFGGPGIPLTFGTFRTSLLSTRNAFPGTLEDPGDRRSGMDWTYRLPKLRSRLTFYGEAFTDDQFSPIAYLDRSAIRAGLYLSRVWGIPKLDLRAEGVYTDVPAGGALSHGFFYSNTRFLNGYTSNGELLGSWIGRESQGAQVWSNYWLSAKNRIQFSFRHQKVSQQFVPGGGTLTDVGVEADYWLSRGIGFSASTQYERWLFPIIRPGPQNDFSASVEIRFQPQRAFRPSFDHASQKAEAPGDQN